MCANCGQFVSPPPKLSLVLGIVLGIVFACVAMLTWFVLGAGTGGLSLASNCARLLWPVAFFVLTFSGCLAALGWGVRAARRGESGLAALVMLPAIGVLLPATPCAVSAFSPCLR